MKKKLKTKEYELDIKQKQKAGLDIPSHYAEASLISGVPGPLDNGVPLEPSGACRRRAEKDPIVLSSIVLLEWPAN